MTTGLTNPAGMAFAQSSEVEVPLVALRDAFTCFEADAAKEVVAAL